MEVTATLWLDARPEGRFARSRFWGWLAFRLAVMALVFSMLVGGALSQVEENKTGPIMPLVGLAPWVARFPYLAAPVLGGGALALLVLVYGVWTVRGRRFRFLTVLVLPFAVTTGLAGLWYLLPSSPLLLDHRRPAPPVEKVFPFPSPTPPKGEKELTDSREIYVLPDERHLVLSFGTTFYFGAPDPNWVHLQGVDLSLRTHWTHRGRVIRRFQSTCSDRLYMSPWSSSTLLEVDPATGEVASHELPSTYNGQQVKEINHVFHDCANHRALVSNSLNPLVFEWDTAEGALRRTVNLVGEAGLRLGDATGIIVPNPATGRLYMGHWSLWPYSELDGQTLKVLRRGRLPGFPFDFHVSSDGAWLYAAAAVEGAIWKVDTRTLDVVATFDAPVHCRRIETTPDGDVLLALSYLTGELLSYDAQTGRLLHTLYIGPKAQGLSVTEHYAWVSAATGVFRVPLEALK
jgi:uncharacterized membrane protein YhaH (DUF805 family)